MILPRRSESRLISCEVCQRYLLEQRESALRLCVREKWLTAHKGEDRGSRMCHYRWQHWAPYLAAFVCKGPAIALTHASTFFTRWSSSAIKRLLLKASVAIDASKFKAVNNRVKSFTSAKIKGYRKPLEREHIAVSKPARRHGCRGFVDAGDTLELRFVDELDERSPELAREFLQLRPGAGGSDALPPRNLRGPRLNP